MTTQKAVCWELESPSAAIHGIRVILAGNFVGVQQLVGTNERPRWAFTAYDTATAATEAAVQVTQTYENNGGKLAIAPGEVMVHPAELRALRNNGPIPPSLRARVFTSLLRRDPRVGSLPKAGE